MIGEFWTRLAIWAALVLYACSVVCFLEKKYWYARLTWIIGCFCYVTHVVLAFHFFHDWSHQSASATTAIQTDAVVGMKNGIGIYFNYFFTIVWVIDAFYWAFVGDDRYVARNPKMAWWLHGFFLFMVVNGAVVFVDGMKRYVGAMLVLLILVNFLNAGLKKLTKS